MKDRDDILREALEAVLPHERAAVAIGTGVGKTLIGLKHMEHYYTDHFRALVVAPKLSIFQSWKDEAKKWNLEYLLDHIDFCTYLSLEKQPQSYDIVYLDECHSLLYSHKPWLSAYKGFILGLTGTPPKYHRSEKGIMVDEFCPVVYEYGVDDAVEDSILNDYRIVVHGLQLDSVKNFRVNSKSGQGWVSSEHENYQYWTKRVFNSKSPKEAQITRVLRMKALMTYPSKVRFAKGLANTITDKCIIFANSKEQCDQLSVHSHYSGNPDSERNLELFKEGKINRLAAILQLSEGINIQNLKQSIVMHAYGNERKFSQRLGRLTRLTVGETAIIHILMYTGTVDEKWVRAALDDFSQDKIVFKDQIIVI